MKKKRFYNNKKRNTKWTEPVRGRKIDFADKYIQAGTGSDKFDKQRLKKRKKRITVHSTGKFFKNILIVFCCFLVVCVGYTAMDLYMERNAMPEESKTADSSDANMSELSLSIQSISVEPLSLDNGVMLDSVLSTVQQGDYSSVTFDLKRDDGTVRYESNLAAVEAYAAVSYASADLEGSVSVLLKNDILPVARISCYKDNIAPVADVSAAVKDGSSLYKDSYGNTYLNPESETVYNYIKGIIEEAKTMGITIFLLDNTQLPDDISDDYEDGFSSLSKQLYADFDDDIKLIEAIAVEAYSSDGESSEDYDDEYDDSDYDEYDEYDKYDEYDEYDEYDDYTQESESDYDSGSDTEDNTDSYSDFDIDYGTNEEETTAYQSQTELEEELLQAIDSTVGNDSVYYITTDSEEEVRSFLEENSITNYVINISSAQQ